MDARREDARQGQADAAVGAQQVEELLSGDGRHAAGGLGHDLRCARLAGQCRQLAEDRTGAKPVQPDFLSAFGQQDHTHRPFEQDEDMIFVLFLGDNRGPGVGMANFGRFDQRPARFGLWNVERVQGNAPSLVLLHPFHSDSSRRPCES